MMAFIWFLLFVSLLGDLDRWFDEKMMTRDLKRQEKERRKAEQENASRTR